jgi:hypothetical protein
MLRTVYFLDPFPEPARFLVEYVDQDESGDGYGNNGVKYRQNDDVYQHLSFGRHGSPPYGVGWAHEILSDSREMKIIKLAARGQRK